MMWGITRKIRRVIQMTRLPVPVNFSVSAFIISARTFGGLAIVRISSVIPAKAGIQVFYSILDPGLRRGDD
jgi:hypothetical protein